jgi:hypothetical protein
MIAKSYISQNLDRIERLFKKATSAKLMLFYSKLAILELGGWIEMSMDDIIRRHAKRLLQDPDSIRDVEAVIKKTYGFEYDQHFKKMLFQIIGLVGFEKLNRSVNGAKIQAMSGSLNSFKVFRDKEAHTYTKGTTRIIDAPSVTKGKLTAIYDGLVEIDNALKKF